MLAFRTGHFFANRSKLWLGCMVTLVLLAFLGVILALQSYDAPAWVYYAALLGIGIGTGVLLERWISSRFRAEQSYRNVYDSLSQAIALRGADGLLVECNASAERLFGVKREQIRGQRYLRNFGQVLDEDGVKRSPSDQTAFLVMSSNTEMARVSGYRNPDGRVSWYLIKASPIVDQTSGKTTGVVTYYNDVTELKEREIKRLDEEAALRRSLVNEVHHRIKNNLQGVIGLLAMESRLDPTIRPVLGRTVGRLEAIAQVFGIGNHDLPHSGSRLVDLVRAIGKVHNDSNDPGVNIEIATANEESPFVTQNEVVPIALVLNELLANAVKHRATTHPVSPVTLRLAANQETALILISNFGLLPLDFDFAARQGAGGGLSLLSALIPKRDASLRYRQTRDCVEAELALQAPLVYWPKESVK